MIDSVLDDRAEIYLHVTLGSATSKLPASGYARLRPGEVMILAEAATTTARQAATLTVVAIESEAEDIINDGQDDWLGSFTRSLRRGENWSQGIHTADTSTG